MLLNMINSGTMASVSMVLLVEFPQRIMWLRIYSTNRDPWIIARYYYETVKLIKGNCKENVICFTFEHVN